MNYIAYFQDIADNTPELGGRCAQVNAGEYEKVVQKDMDVQQPSLVIELQPGRFIDAKSDNIQEITPVSWAVIQHVSPDAYQEMREKQQVCRGIALKILGQLRATYRLRTVLHHLNIDEATHRHVFNYHFHDTTGYEITVPMGMSVMRLL